MFEILIGFISGIVSRNGNGRRNNIDSSPFYLYEPRSACSTSNKFNIFIPTAITSVIIGIKNKNINVKEALVIVVSGIIGAIISANISSNLNVNLLRKMFGAFLLIIAIYEIYSWFNMYIKNKKGHNKIR